MTAEITAPESLQGMTFALYKEVGTGYELVTGTEITIADDVRKATLTWEHTDAMSNEKLHVFQVTADGFVADGTENSSNMTVHYGPAVFAGANNGNYIDQIIFPSKVVEGSDLKVFNMTDYYPEVVLGPTTRLYERVNGEMVPLDWENTSGSRQVYVNYFYPNPDNPDELLMDYIKFNGTNYVNGVFVSGGNVIKIKEANTTNYASGLVDNSKKLSRELANMGGGVIDPEKGTTPNREGSSTVTGPIDSNGQVVSIYDVEVGSDWNLNWSQDTGWEGIPVADNEYVVVNVICPTDGTGENEMLRMSANDAGGLNYFVEGALRHLFNILDSSAKVH